MAPPTPGPRTPPLPWPPVQADDGPGPVRHHTTPYRPLDRGPLTPAPGFGSGWEPLPPRIDTAPEPRRDRHPTVVSAAALALVLIAGAAVVAGVLLGGSAQDSPSAAPPTGEPAGTSPVADLAAGATVPDGAAFGTDPLRFRSPTGNIGCVLGSDGVRCDVTDRDWQLPPAPADCTSDWGAGLSLPGAGPAGPTCGGATVADPSATPLGYGQALRNGDLTCVSRRTGIECGNAVTGHGFTASRASFDTH